VIFPLLAALQLATGPVLMADSTMPALTLAEALQRGTGLNPNYVGALGRVGEAEWGRRNAMMAFVIPSVDLQMNWTNYSTAFFNIGTGQAQLNQVQGSLTANYEIISVRKITELGRTRADLEAASANEVQQRYRAALLIESTFYEVLAEAELLRVADDRARRAEEQLAVARARVLSGATVQTDSLQLVLEFTRARVEQLRTRTLLDVARLELGRRTGSDGPVDAVPLETPVPQQLPLTLDQAVADALATGPDWMIARAQAHAAERRLQGLRGEYLPRLDLTYNRLQFDDHFYPSAFGVSALNLRVSWSLWDLGRRELAIAQATTQRNVADAVSADLMRAARHDVARAYEAFETARAALDLQTTSVVVAQETYRVQQERYKSGAATILDLLDAQVNLTQAQADLVQAQFVARLAWAGLEAILGRRLTPSN
jgi:outer membrane protein TolC